MVGTRLFSRSFNDKHSAFASWKGVLSQSFDDAIHKIEAAEVVPPPGHVENPFP